MTIICVIKNMKIERPIYMETKTYRIVLTDGTVLDSLRMNGNTFVSHEPVDPAMFEGNCSGVIISDGMTEETHDFMEYVPTAQPVTGEFWFVLRDISEQELTMMRMQANIEYIGMMTSVEL